MSDPCASVLPIGTTKGNEMTTYQALAILARETRTLTDDEAQALIIAALTDKAFI